MPQFMPPYNLEMEKYPLAPPPSPTVRSATMETLERLNDLTLNRTISQSQIDYLNRVDQLLYTFTVDAKVLTTDIKILEAAAAKVENNDNEDVDSVNEFLPHHDNGGGGEETTITEMEKKEQEQGKVVIQKLKDDLLAAKFFVKKLTLYKDHQEKKVRMKVMEDKVEYLLNKN